MTNRSHPKPTSLLSPRVRGFATVIALITVGLIGATVATLVTHVSNEARRTVDESERAQLRQLATAGLTAPSLATIRLPSTVVNDGYALTIQSKTENGKTARMVRAKKGEHVAVMTK